MNFLSNIRLVFSLVALGFFVPTPASASVPAPVPEPLSWRSSRLGSLDSAQQK